MCWADALDICLALPITGRLFCHTTTAQNRTKEQPKHDSATYCTLDLFTVSNFKQLAGDKEHLIWRRRNTLRCAMAPNICIVANPTPLF